MTGRDDVSHARPLLRGQVACDNDGVRRRSAAKGSPLYLFKPKARAAEGSTVGADRSGQDAAESSPFGGALPAPGLQPGSAAEWALGELLIRLCNRGRGLPPEPPQAAPE